MRNVKSGEMGYFDMGRPRKTIDYELVENLASIFCTQEEIASVLGVAVRTLQNRKKFLRTYKKGMEKGKASLRRRQFEAAQKGNATMQIWLGKQYLDQKDKHEVDNTHQDIPTVVVDDSKSK